MATSTAPTDAPAATTSTRLLSLDAFRGITIVGMILVNNPGTWGAVYPPLLHADWHGWTPTDLIFPFFLFIVGVAITFAYQKRLAQGVPKGPLVAKALRRAAILFGLGLVLATYPFVTFDPFGLRDFGSMRIMGVLQRIAVCYLVVSLLVLYTTPRTQAVVAGALLLGYWAAMMLVPVPGYGPGLIDDKVGNLAAYLDRLLLDGHLWRGADGLWDPEGLFSTLPAIGTTLFGVWAGRILRRPTVPLETTTRLLVYGMALVCVGYAWAWVFPINKPIWTSSYAVFTAGQAFCALGVCYWLTDVRGHRRWAQPFVAYGINAITVFVLSGLLARTLYLIKVPTADGGTTSLQAWFYQTVLAPLGPPRFTSLLYALLWIGAWYVVLAWMRRRNLVLKV
ncbi:MAG: heparan-alpha-glucosaminide N-acetyltransferase domain-containing protein [Bacteroidota bacterium]